MIPSRPKWQLLFVAAAICLTTVALGATTRPKPTMINIPTYSTNLMTAINDRAFGDYEANFIAVGGGGGHLLVSPTKVVSQVRGCPRDEGCTSECRRTTADPNNMLTFFSNGKGLQAWNTSNKLVWRANDLDCSDGPTYYGSKIYLVNNTGSLAQVSVTDGTINWLLAGNFSGRPVISKKTILIKDDNRGLCSVSLGGKLEWCNADIIPLTGTAATLSIVRTPWITQEVFVQDTKYNIHKVSLHDGKAKWTVTDLKAPRPRNNADNGVYMTSNKCSVFAYNGTTVLQIDRVTGKITVIAEESSSKASGGLCIAGDLLYNVYDGTYTRVYDLKTGEQYSVADKNAIGGVYGCVAQRDHVYLVYSTDRMFVYPSTESTQCPDVTEAPTDSVAPATPSPTPKTTSAPPATTTAAPPAEPTTTDVPQTTSAAEPTTAAVPATTSSEPMTSAAPDGTTQPPASTQATEQPTAAPSITNTAAPNPQPTPSATPAAPPSVTGQVRLSGNNFQKLLDERINSLRNAVTADLRRILQLTTSQRLVIIDMFVGSLIVDFNVTNADSDVIGKRLKDEQEDSSASGAKWQQLDTLVKDEDPNAKDVSVLEYSVSGDDVSPSPATPGPATTKGGSSSGSCARGCQAAVGVASLIFVVAVVAVIIIVHKKNNTQQRSADSVDTPTPMQRIEHNML